MDSKIIDGEEVAARYPFNGLTEQEAEALYVLSEECAEVIEAVMKILRHGLQSWNPMDEQSLTNRGQLEKELGHIDSASGRLIHLRMVSQYQIAVSSNAKTKTIGRWLHHDDPAPTDNQKLPKETE